MEDSNAKYELDLHMDMWSNQDWDSYIVLTVEMNTPVSETISRVDAAHFQKD